MLSCLVKYYGLFCMLYLEAAVWIKWLLSYLTYCSLFLYLQDTPLSLRAIRFEILFDEGRMKLPKKLPLCLVFKEASSYDVKMLKGE